MRRGAVWRERARLFSLPERFNQVHIGAADQKDPLLVCGSGSRVFASPWLLPSLKKNISSRSKSKRTQSFCDIHTVDLGQD